ncbi:zinc finger protein CONSTANS-like [Impatiens glandulifera]|uniref:zinc finger protein CONSTANS-like n=1 Tax=Impatiens glandulifera TaxID=253017 RepID=UPI001FB14AE1|nr:zinc finger protein CONSTANS-like [Impatiens glandulifera]
MKKKCELCCDSIANVLCESDRAVLCWDCDSKIHASNFLFAKHLRFILCHSCHCPSSWTSSGPNLTPILAVCHACAVATRKILGSNGVDGGQGPESDHGEEEIEDDRTRVDDQDEDNDNDEENNQVVPQSSHTAPIFNGQPGLF